LFLLFVALAGCFVVAADGAAQQEVSRQMKRSDTKPAGQQKQQPHQLQQQSIRRERQIAKTTNWNATQRLLSKTGEYPETSFFKKYSK